MNVISGLIVTVLGGVAVWAAIDYLEGDPPAPVPTPQPTEQAAICAGASMDICARYDAICQTTDGLDGRRSDLCTWPEIQAKAPCEAAKGLWTTEGSRYALRHPALIPAGRTAYCATEVQNLNN